MARLRQASFTGLAAMRTPSPPRTARPEVDEPRCPALAAPSSLCTAPILSQRRSGGTARHQLCIATARRRGCRVFASWMGAGSRPWKLSVVREADAVAWRRRPPRVARPSRSERPGLGVRAGSASVNVRNRDRANRGRSCQRCRPHDRDGLGSILPALAARELRRRLRLRTRARASSAWSVLVAALLTLAPLRAREIKQPEEAGVPPHRSGQPSRRRSCCGCLRAYPAPTPMPPPMMPPPSPRARFRSTAAARTRTSRDARRRPSAAAADRQRRVVLAGWRTAWRLPRVVRRRRRGRDAGAPRYPLLLASKSTCASSRSGCRRASRYPRHRDPPRLRGGRARPCAAAGLRLHRA